LTYDKEAKSNIHPAECIIEATLSTSN